MRSNPKYWFAAKRCGWGWGLPTARQRRLVLTAFIGLVAAGALVFPPNRSIAALSDT